MKQGALFSICRNGALLYNIGDKMMRILVLNGSPRPNGNTRQMIAAFREGALFSYRGDFLEFLGLEDMGVFTAYGNKNGSDKKRKGLYNLGRSLVSD